MHVEGNEEWAFDSEFVVELNLDPVGLVYCYPAWNYEDNCYDYTKPSDEYLKVASQTSRNEVLYFGIRTEEGTVTPITDVSKIAIEGGAILEKYEAGSDGFYTLTLPERDKEYTFTYDNSSIRIRRDTPIIQFSSDASCQNELFDTVTVENGNTAFYIILASLGEENAYEYIVGMDEENKSDTEGYYFRKDYTTDSVIQTSGSAPITVTQVNAAGDGASSAKIYKIEVKNTAPDEFSLRIKAKINEWWTEDVTIQIENKISGSTTTGGGTVIGGGGTSSSGSTNDPNTTTGDSNTITETKPDGSTVETTTETKSDGTKIETITETKTDGTKIETSTETKTDGSKVESSTKTKTDGSKTETVVETAADGSVKTTEMVTLADGSATKTEKENETNTKGKDVAVTTTTKTDSTGAVTSVTEKSVIANSSATTSTTITVKKDGEGAITSAIANIAKTVNSGNKATVSAAIVSQIVEAAGTESVSVTMTVKDSEGKTKYKVKVEAESLQAGEELFIYKLNTKTGEYTMVSAKTYEVNESGSVAVSMSQKATYELVTAESAAAIDKQIKSTIKPKKTSADVKPGKTTDFALSSKANEDNIKSITYTTSKKSVATVNKNGKITAKGKGSVTIKAKVTLKNGSTKTIKMTIKVK